MKKTFLYLSALLILNACQKDTDILIPDNPTGPNTTWYSVVPDSAAVNTLRAALAPAASADSFTVYSTGTTGYGGGPVPGLFLSIPQGALTTGGGSTFYGTAFFKGALLKTKGEMISAGISTTSNGALLVSGGALYIELKDNAGNTLSVTPNRSIMASYPDSPVYQQMKLYNGSPVTSNIFNWTPETDPLASVSTGSDFYLLYTTRLNWIGPDYLFDYSAVPTGQTKIALDLPSNYTNANSVAFVSFDNMRSVVALGGDAITRQFRSGIFPAGKPVTIVVMSKQANDYFMGTVQTVTDLPGSSADYQTVTLTPTITTLQNIQTYLSTL
jgi:hypothetical protein